MVIQLLKISEFICTKILNYNDFCNSYVRLGNVYVGVITLRNLITFIVHSSLFNFDKGPFGNDVAGKLRGGGGLISRKAWERWLPGWVRSFLILSVSS